MFVIGSLALFFLISFGYIYTTQNFLARASDFLYKTVEDHAQKLNVNENKTAELLKRGRKIRDDLGWIRTIIGISEIIFFAFVTVFIFFSHDEKLITLFQFVGGWVAIKAIGNYSKWSDENYGRVIFYNFLILTFANIFFAIWLGLAAIGFWSIVWPR